MSTAKDLIENVIEGESFSIGDRVMIDPRVAKGLKTDRGNRITRFDGYVVGFDLDSKSPGLGAGD